MNNLEVNVTLKRIDICDLLIACNCAKKASNGAEKWDKLHELLQAQLYGFDSEKKLGGKEL